MEFNAMHPSEVSMSLEESDKKFIADALSWYCFGFDEAEADFKEKVKLFSVEVLQGFRGRLKSGKINGRYYTTGCSSYGCFVGTLRYFFECEGGSPDTFPVESDMFSPAERFFYGVDTGHYPANSPFVRVALKWLDEVIESKG
jgi:hypothetical protein